VLAASRLCSPAPLYDIAGWASSAAVTELLGTPAALLNDDRLGRSLEALAKVAEDVRGQLMLTAVRRFPAADASRLHLDLTAVRFAGSYPGPSLVARAGPPTGPSPGRSRPCRRRCRPGCRAAIVFWGCTAGASPRNSRRRNRPGGGTSHTPVGAAQIFTVSLPLRGDARVSDCRQRGRLMRTKALAIFTAASAVAAIAAGVAGASAGTAARGGYEPVLNPRDFVRVISNPYYPLPVGRTLTYRGVRDGVTQTAVVHVTRGTKVLEGITATTVTDVARHGSRLLEKTTDWFAQDKHGNVWYLGEDTARFLPGGTVDRSGSWQAGVHDAEPGIIMLARPQVPNAYRQEFLRGQAEDTAWIVDQGGTVTVPFGTLHNVLTTLEFTRLEPDVIDQKLYAPGLGIVREHSETGPLEVAQLVSVTG
jgi:hypothetical protein